MGVPTSEVSYTSATTRRGDYEVHKGHVVALDKKKFILLSQCVLKKHNDSKKVYKQWQFLHLQEN
jgi:hypothetical protein